VESNANALNQKDTEIQIDRQPSWVGLVDLGCHELFWMNQATETMKTKATHQLRDAAIPAIAIAIMVVLFPMSG
jgi:hypothetical protein